MAPPANVPLCGQVGHCRVLSLDSCQPDPLGSPSSPVTQSSGWVIFGLNPFGVNQGFHPVVSGPHTWSTVLVQVQKSVWPLMSGVFLPVLLVRLGEKPVQPRHPCSKWLQSLSDTLLLPWATAYVGPGSSQGLVSSAGACPCPSPLGNKGKETKLNRSKEQLQLLCPIKILQMSILLLCAHR